MAHSISPAAEAILDKEFPVLNHGFVRLIDYLGSDDRIVQAARVSYGDGTKTMREDVALIDYLLSNDHTSPFEQVILTFHCKMPIFVARQWIRHRTARVNEISGRYSVMEDEFFLPELNDVSRQSSSARQGRGESFPPHEAAPVIERLDALQRAIYAEYRSDLDRGVARELARVNLPLSLYTQWYWQIDLNNMFRFLKLRLAPHAQKEIRVYAEEMLKLTEAVAPMATAAFKKRVLGSERFSPEEVEALAKLAAERSDLLPEDEDKRRRLLRKLKLNS